MPASWRIHHTYTFKPAHRTAEKVSLVQNLDYNDLARIRELTKKILENKFVNVDAGERAFCSPSLSRPPLIHGLPFFDIVEKEIFERITAARKFQS